MQLSKNCPPLIGETLAIFLLKTTAVSGLPFVIVTVALAPRTVRGHVVGLSPLSQYEVEIVRGIYSVVDVGRVGQHHLPIGQHLGQGVLIGIALEAELQHGVPDNLRRTLVVRQHYRLVQHHALRLHVVRLHSDLDDVEVRRALVRVAGTGQSDEIGSAAVGRYGACRWCQTGLMATTTARAQRHVQGRQRRARGRAGHLRR